MQTTALSNLTMGASNLRKGSVAPQGGWGPISEPLSHRSSVWGLHVLTDEGLRSSALGMSQPHAMVQPSGGACGPVPQGKARRGGTSLLVVALRAALAAGALFILLRTDEKLRHREAAIQPGTRSLEAKPELNTCSGSCLCPWEFPSRFPLSGRLVNYSARAQIHAAHVHMHTPSLTP